MRSLKGRAGAEVTAGPANAASSFIEGLLRRRGCNLAHGRIRKRDLAALAENGPADNLQIAARIFDEGGTAFNPVPVIEVKNPSDLLHRRMVNMATHDAVKAAL